jgi:hypothetical protein
MILLSTFLLQFLPSPITHYGKKSVSFQRENQIRLRGKFLQQQNGHFVFMVRPIISSDHSYNKVSNTKEVVLCHSVSDVVAVAAAVSVAAAAASDHQTSG